MSSASRPNPLGRLIIVSNRLPLTIKVENGNPILGESSGGLVTGLIRHHEAADTIWVGYPGDTTSLDPSKWLDVERELAERRIVAVQIKANEYRRYYDGFANGVIWPVFHYLTGRLPPRTT